MGASRPCRRGKAPCGGRRAWSCRRRWAWPCRRRWAWPCRRRSGYIAIQPCLAPLLPCYDTPDCIMTRPASQASPQSQYTYFYCNTILSPKSFPRHNTKCVLQYKNLATCPCWPQYIAVYCDTPSHHAT